MDDIAVGGRDQCEGRRTDATVKLEEEVLDATSKKRSRFLDTLDAKRSRQCRVRPERAPVCVFV